MNINTNIAENRMEQIDVFKNLGIMLNDRGAQEDKLAPEFGNPSISCII